MPEPRLLNITIPVYNRPELTEKTVEGVRGTRFPFPHVLTVVDNGSGRETVDLLLRLKAHKLIDILLLSASNLGVAFAANLGWRAVAADLYLKLDNDIQVLDPDWLGRVLARWKEAAPAAAVAASWHDALYDEGEKIATGAGELSRCPTNLAGGAILIPREVSDVLGFWNEDYGLYGTEDGDYCLRMRTAGFPRYYYRSQGLLLHAGVTEGDREKTYASRGLDKGKLARAAFPENDYEWGLFPLNALLYSLRVRSVRVPLKYECLGLGEGYRVAVRISRRYLEFRKGLLLCRELIRAIFPDNAGPALLSTGAVAHMRAIMRRHGDNELV
ncbi:MAG: glycosyltransferase [Desulfovibrio sp.]|jgi:GT2 family glycosyltransferase|nr:glycosyltransferase [Desulfovibrio sp.]